jgi:hypothetical protein
MTKEEFLNQHVFYGLTNLNDGFDVIGIKYFSQKDFETVLARVEKLDISVFGIEPWIDGDYYDAKGYEDYNKKPNDSQWYKKAFSEFKELKIELQYSASYDVPHNLLIN